MSLIDTQVQKVKDIAGLLQTNQAFINPFAQAIEGLNTTIDQAEALVTGATIGSPLYANATNILLAIETLKTNTSNFLSHTNNISGVGLSQGLNGADFATITQVMATVNRYRDDNGTCEFINTAFGALQQVAQISQSITTLIGQLENIETIPDQIENFIQNLSALLSSRIEADTLAFAEARLRAFQLAVAQNLTAITNNPCLSEIISIVGTNEIRNIIRPVIVQTI